MGSSTVRVCNLAYQCCLPEFRVAVAGAAAAVVVLAAGVVVVVVVVAVVVVVVIVLFVNMLGNPEELGAVSFRKLTGTRYCTRSPKADVEYTLQYHSIP